MLELDQIEEIRSRCKTFPIKNTWKLLVPFLLLFSSCELSLPDEELQSPEDVESMEELQVPEDFEFTISRTQLLTLEVSDSNGQALSGVPFGIYNGPADRGGDLLSAGATNEAGLVSFEISIPSSQEKVYAYTPYGIITQNQMIPLSDEDLIFQWGSGETVPDGSRRMQSSSFECAAAFYQVIGNSLKKLDVLSGTYITVGDAKTNYNGIGYNVEDSLIYGTRKDNGNIHLWRIGTDGKETDLGAISGYTGNNAYKGDFNLNGNLYSPYFESGNWTLFITDVSETPLNATSSSITELNEVANAHDFAYNALQNKFYGMTQNSELIELDHQNLTIQVIKNYQSEIGNGTYGALWCDVNGNIYCGNNQNGDIHKITMTENGTPTDITYIMTSQSTNNNDGASCPLSTAPTDDTDDDTVLDGIDEYPTDPNIAYATFLPAKNVFGSYAFEDLWPAKGDYDFNDLIINYNYEIAKDPANDIEKIIMRFRIRAIGAGFQSSFGVSFDDLIPSQISSVSGTETTTISTASNGVENGQSKAVIIVFDNGQSLFGEQPGKFINSGGTGPGYVEKDSYELTIEINLINGISNVGRINPFIYTKGVRGNEIHMKNYPPTDLVNTSLLNTQHDKSNSSTGVYYQTSNGLPWAMEFPASFNYPIERVEVLKAYPKFGNWVLSAGTNDTDWYDINNARVDSVFIK